MKISKPAFEKISPEFGSSLLIKKHNEQIENKLPFWHFHPELELGDLAHGNGVPVRLRVCFSRFQRCHTSK